MSDADADVITLDVGGQKFKTYHSTLRKCPMLDSMINAGKDHIFLDMDPLIFRHILEFLRFPEYIMPQTCRYMLKTLKISYKNANIKIAMNESMSFIFTTHMIKVLKARPDNSYTTKYMTITIDNYYAGSAYHKKNKEVHISPRDIVDEKIKYAAFIHGDDLLDDLAIFIDVIDEIAKEPLK
jgi:hypothetical protein